MHKATEDFVRLMVDLIHSVSDEVARMYFNVLPSYACGDSLSQVVSLVPGGPKQDHRTGLTLIDNPSVRIVANTDCLVSKNWINKHRE